MADLKVSTADLVAGIALAGTGAAFALGARRYDLGSAADMGPGMFPLAAALVLLVLGVLVLVLAVLSPAKELTVDDAGHEHEQIRQFGRMPWRAILFITASVSWFAFTVEPLGFLAATFGAAVLASLAAAGLRWWQPLAVGAGLTVLCYLIFVVALGLRAPAIGELLGG